MPITKRIVCLANSRKKSGRCLAGKELTPRGLGAWIRPVTHRDSGALYEFDRLCEHGGEPRLLDILDVPLLKPYPHGCQVENWRLDPHTRIKRAGILPWDNLRHFAESPPALWINGHHSLQGQNDEVPSPQGDALTSSLYLIAVSTIRLCTTTTSNFFQGTRRRVRAEFLFAADTYNLVVTDPIIEQEVFDKQDGHACYGECLLTISLSELFCKSSGGASRYKLVAAVMRQ